MAKNNSEYRCDECGWVTAKWVGRCGECQTWGSVTERTRLGGDRPGRAGAGGRTAAAPVTRAAVPISAVTAVESQACSSGIDELDRVLGDGLVPGAAILLAGDPGVGKSTLLLEVASATAAAGRRALYVTGEESASQVRLRADRTGAVRDELYLAAETDLGAVLSHIEEVRPELVVIDSVQTIGSADIDGVPGGVGQVKEVATALVRVAKLHHITMVLVGHVTKEGGIAGPRVLEHLVDVVLHFEGERSSRLRLVRAIKNRFGPIDEVGCFDLTASGITAIADPSGLFLDVRRGSVPGTCVAVHIEGRRPLLGEVQALVAPASSERPRRTTSGVDSARLAMIIAVLHQHAGVRLHHHDVFVATVGGARLQEPSNDLAIALALVSSLTGRPLGRQLVAVGELGLSGELRRVGDLDLRLGEAGRLGFRSALVPAETDGADGRSGVRAGVRVTEIDHVIGALSHAGLLGDDTAGGWRPTGRLDERMF